MSLCLLTGCSKFTVEIPNITPKYEGLNAFFYNQYNEEEKKVYDKIYTALENQQKKVDLDNCNLTSEEIFDIASQVSDDHPEFFYFFGDTQYHSEDYTIYQDNTLTLKYAYSDEQIAEYQNQLEEIKEDYLKATEGMSLIEILDYTYNYLIENTTYDTATFETLPAILDAPDSYGIIGCFFNHTCVCAGYAKAFQYLLNLHNYECLYINGYLNNNRHAWNAVNIDGTYYHFDVTSDDPNDDTYPKSFYQFYGLNTNQILQTHIIDNFVAETDDISYNYHYCHHHYISSIDLLDAVISAQEGQEMISIQCSSYELYNEVIDQLITQKQFTKYMHTNKIMYMLDEPLYLIQFYTTNS